MSDNCEPEKQRLRLQEALDAAKSQKERNRLGQFATPTALAIEMLELAKMLIPQSRPIRFLDPALGIGSFYSALLRCFGRRRIKSAVGYEIDPYYGKPASRLWKGTPLELRLADFTRAKPPAEELEKATLIVCNPPYVRHHHLGAHAKQRLRLASAEAAAVDFNGLAGLYCHFVSLAHAWMAHDALALWLIPGEFMDVNYGKTLKEYLVSRVTLLRIHRFDPNEVQFEDALVSSTVVCLRNSPPEAQQHVEFTYGGSLLRPERTRVIAQGDLRPDRKWGRLALPTKDTGAADGQPEIGNFFEITRGIATGANDFFILAESRAGSLGIPDRFLKPILPGPRLLKTDEVRSDECDNPLLEDRLFLLDCRLPEEEVRVKHPRLWNYLESGRARGIHERYLCKHRSPWYAQENRRPAPILCTYMGRKGTTGRAFRFILNHSQAIAANVYLLLYPKPVLARLLEEKPDLLKVIWNALTQIPPDVLTDAGRVYGGGLHKLEPKELAAAPATTVLAVLPGGAALREHQLSLSW